MSSAALLFLLGMSLPIAVAGWIGSRVLGQRLGAALAQAGASALAGGLPAALLFQTGRHYQAAYAIVLGRRNWLFTWEDLGGERTAQVLTIVGTCVAHGVNPRFYLYLLTKLIINGWPQAKLRDLLPDRLAIAHPDLLARDGPTRPGKDPSSPARSS